MASITLNGNVIRIHEGPDNPSGGKLWNIDIRVQPEGGSGEASILTLRFPLARAQQISANQAVTVTVETT